MSNFPPIQVVRNTVKNLLNFRRISQSMETAFRHPTPAELVHDSDCVICREANTAESSRILPCGHILHESCLKSWSMRKQVSPREFHQ